MLLGNFIQIFFLTVFSILSRLGPQYAPPKIVILIMFILPGLMLELVAFIMGIISWRDNYGKAATIVSGIVLVLVAFFIVYNIDAFKDVG